MGRQRTPAVSEGDPHAASVERTCRSCGRRMEDRASWAKHGVEDEVRYCSDACRRRKVTATDRRLEESILELLADRARAATVCPSEAARAVAGRAGEDDDAVWRELMEPARRAARRLAASGDVEIVQGGHVVDPSAAKGPIRIRRA